MHIIGSLCAIGAGIFFGFIGPITKIAYNLGVGLGLAILLRYLIATLLITPLVILNRPTYSIYKNHFWLLMLLTIGSILLSTGLLISVKYIDASLAILIFCTYPLIVLFTSMFLDGEQINLKIKSVFLIVFAGLFLVLGPSFESLNTIGVISAFIASIGASTVILTNQKLSNRKINALHINAFTNFFNFIFFLLIILFFFEININLSSKAWLIILIHSFCYAVAFFYNSQLFQELVNQKQLYYYTPNLLLLF